GRIKEGTKIGTLRLPNPKKLHGHSRKITLAKNNESEFKRKPIDEITNAPDDPCIQAVRLAPSGMNLQPWYLEKADNKTLLYEQVLKPPVSLAYRKTAVDMGIALCHYALACRRFGKPFSFERQSGLGDKRGYRLFGALS
ncbi:MAG: hypothetical protein LIV22_05500, partial [Olegusella sp.]|nr:hypothetical protein [Olegusella sp.]